MHTPDLVAANLDKVAVLFPACIVETKGADGTVHRAIDFDQLRQELAASVVEGPQERYRLDWPGKREAMLAANAPIAKTLRPRTAESSDFDKTKNLYIEGDNLEALKLIQETYLEKVRFIYIDPPYNTGNEFLYEDDFAMDSETYFRRSNQTDDQGTRMVLNSESNGRLHSDWLSMLYPRLKLSRSLLRDDGVIFISIDDHEVANLRKCCDEIFGEQNFISSVSRMMKSGGAKGTFFTPNIEFILIYAKNISAAAPFRDTHSQEQIEGYYNKQQTDGPRKGELYGEERLYKASLDPRPNQRYWIECPDGSFCIPPGLNFPEKIVQGEKITPTADDGVWKWTFNRYQEELTLKNIIFKETATSALVSPGGKQSKWNIYNKIWLKEQQAKGMVPSNFIGDIENRQSAAELKAIEIPFAFAKPSNLVKHLLTISGAAGDDIVLDFFSGSATSAHAVMAFNAETGHRLRYIMVQLPEACDPKTEAYKAGFKTIADIGKERIRRVAQKIKEENATSRDSLDLGFRVLGVDTSNMKDVYYRPDGLAQSDLLAQADNIREDRTHSDLLFQVMLDWGIDLALPISPVLIAGSSVFIVDGNALAACFESDLSEELVTSLAKRREQGLPLLKVVFRDASYRTDSAKINVEQIFKLLSPTTEIRTL